MVIRIGADVGGTFTDVILVDAAGWIEVHKLPSTPPDFGRAVVCAIEAVLAAAGAGGSSVREVAHGTTVATNAVLERRGAKTALLTTRGFRDVLALRRIRLPVLYDWFFEKPQELVPRHLRFEVTERIGADGRVITPVQASELNSIVQSLRSQNVESVAICLLHAYAFSQHEQQVGDLVSKLLPEAAVSVSSQVLAQRKEYERTATTVVNAYIQPIMQGYLQAMLRDLQGKGIDAPLMIMQSAGGLTTVRDASLRPVYVLESGPAAGVLAARDTAARAGLDNVLTLDMGGTTAKASIIEDGKVAYSPEYEVGGSLSAGGVGRSLMGGGGELISAPSLDIAEVGAGGGSIAKLDSGGGLRVGPHSAGAVPGPVCYGLGGEQPTLTDANVVLGYIRAGKLGDGHVTIDPEAARRSVHDQVAKPLNLDLYEAAAGIHQIANATTMRALREVSVQRGHDPRDFALIAFGGSGPIHAAALAMELGMAQTIVPPLPGLFSALGLLIAGVLHQRVRSCLLSGSALTAERIGGIRGELEEQLLGQFEQEGYPPQQVDLELTVDMRFKGQTSEIPITLTDDVLADPSMTQLRRTFEEAHEQLYGHRSEPDNPVELLTVRVTGHAAVNRKLTAVGRPRTAEGTSRQAYFGGRLGLVQTPVVDRASLSVATPGPLLIDEYDCTIVIPPATRAHLDGEGNIVVRSE